MKNKILNKKQILLIDCLPDEVLTHFYLAGGTALSAFYLKHRLSNDLDFFTDAEDKMPAIEFLTRMLRRIEFVDTIRFERLYDRRIFSIMFKDGDMLKVEFTVYPFKSMEKRKKVAKLFVDSPLNIVTGKLMALTDRYDPKDIIDLYFLLRKYPWKLQDLIKKTEFRFGIKGLEFTIPERLLFANRITIENLPVMIKKINLEEMKKYFAKQSHRLLNYYRKRRL
jgi:hypothetical protein